MARRRGLQKAGMREKMLEKSKDKQRKTERKSAWEGDVCHKSDHFSALTVVMKQRVFL